MAYLVGAETTVHRRPLPDGMRHAHLELAGENVGGGLYDLEAEGLLSPDVDVAGAPPADRAGAAGRTRPAGCSTTSTPSGRT